MIRFILLFFVVCLMSCSSAPAPAPTAAAAAPVAESEAAKTVAKPTDKPTRKDSSIPVVCKLGEDFRTITVITLPNSGCELHYKKYGNVTTVANGSQGTEHCKKVQEKMKANLVSSKFTCE